MDSLSGKLIPLNAMSTVENKNVIRMFIEDILNQGRLERADDLVLEDFVELDPLPGQSQGREGLKQVIREMRTSFPDMHWKAEEMIAEGFYPLHMDRDPARSISRHPRHR
jgi:predicted SnoaL-like aldol condensation-catalyzing enzyme